MYSEFSRDPSPQLVCSTLSPSLSRCLYRWSVISCQWSYFFYQLESFSRQRNTWGQGQGRTVLGLAGRGTCRDVEQVSSPAGHWGSARSWSTLDDARLPWTAFKHHLEASFVSVLSLGTCFPFTCLQALFFPGQRSGEITEDEDATTLLQPRSPPHRARLCGSLHHYLGAKCHTHIYQPGFQTLVFHLKTFVPCQGHLRVTSLKRHTRDSSKHITSSSEVVKGHACFILLNLISSPKIARVPAGIMGRPWFGGGVIMPLNLGCKTTVL